MSGTYSAMSIERPRPRIMVVDDDDETRALLADLLDCYTVVQAQGWQDLSAYLAPHRVTYRGSKPRPPLPDLILLDIMMPGFDGLEVLNSLRGGEFARIPVVIVTGCADSHGQCMEALCREAGARGYLHKPIDIDGLLLIIRGLVGG